MQKILTPMSDLGVQIACLPGTLFPLMLRKSPLLIPIPTRRFNLATIRTGRHGFQPKINADVLCSGGGFRFRHFNHEIDIPALTRILTKTSAFHQTREFPALPESEGLTGITYRIINNINAQCLKGNPTRRPLPAPAQFAFLKLLATGFILFAHRLNSLRMQPQFFTAFCR